MLLENLVRANHEAIKNYQTLLRTIGPQPQTPDLEQTRSLDLPPYESPIGNPTDGSSAVGAPFISTIRSLAPPDETITPMPSSVVQDHSRLESTIRGCLKRIENALLQFEQSSSLSTSEHKIAVSIELEKDIRNSSSSIPEPLKPWIVLSIVRNRNISVPNTVSSTPLPVNLATSTKSEFGGASLATASGTSDPRNQRTAMLQAEIDGTVAVMRQHMHQVLERGERLDTLQDRTESLGVSADGFRSARRRISKASHSRSKKPWLSAVWDSLPSLPSPTESLASIQE